MTSRLRSAGDWVLALIAPALAFVAANVDRNYQTDLWHHLARGREIVRHGRLLDHDVFTCTVPDRPFMDPNWLSQVAFFGLYRAGGLPLLQLVNAALLAGTVGLVVFLCWRAGGSLRLAAGLGTFTFLGLWQLVLIRPQSFSLLLFVGLYAVLTASDRHPRLLWLPPLVLALWVNLHGAFPIGFILVGVFLAGHLVAGWLSASGRNGGCPLSSGGLSPFRPDALSQGRDVLRDPQTWRLALCLVGSIAATLINPYGWTIYQYVGGTSATAAGRSIEEWVPPSTGLFIGKMWMASLLLTVLALALPGRRPTARQVCLLLAFLPPACGAVRMLAWWFLSAGPVLAARLAAGLPETWTKDDESAPVSPLDPAMLGLLLLAAALSVPGLQAWNPLLKLTWSPHRLEDDLQAVADHLDAEGSDGCTWSRFEWGEYLSWARGPGQKVFIDGRIEIYPDTVWRDYEAVLNAHADWQEVLDLSHVHNLVLDRRQHGLLLAAVERSPRWRQTFERGPAVLFVRTTGNGD